MRYTQLKSYGVAMKATHQNLNKKISIKVAKSVVDDFFVEVGNIRKKQFPNPTIKTLRDWALENRLLELELRIPFLIN